MCIPSRPYGRGISLNLAIPVMFAVLLVVGATNTAFVAGEGPPDLPAPPKVTSDKNGILSGTAHQKDGLVGDLSVTLYIGKHSHETVGFKRETLEPVGTVETDSEGRFSFNISQDPDVTYTLVSDDKSKNSSEPTHHTVTNPVPDIITDLRAETQNGTIVLRWSIPNDGGSAIIDYIITQGIDRGDLPQGHTLEHVDLYEGIHTRPIHLITEYEKGVTYEFRVAAENDAGKGLPSNIARLVIPVTPDTTPPALLSASYDKSTGRFIATFDEIIKKSSIDPTKFKITHNALIVRPSAQELETTTDGTTVTFLLTGSNKNPVDTISYGPNRFLGLDADAVTDLAGNGIVQSTESTRKTFTVTSTSGDTDSKLEPPTITSPADNSIHFGQRFSIAGGNAPAGSTVHIYYKDSLDSDKNLGFTFPKADGSWTFLVSNYKAADSSYHIPAGSETIYAVVQIGDDTSRPSNVRSIIFDYLDVSIDLPSDDTTVGSTYTVSGTVSGTTPIVKLYDGATLLGSTSDFTGTKWSIILNNQPNDDYTLTARVANDVGNDANSPQIDVTVDSTSPGPDPPAISRVVMVDDTAQVTWSDTNTITINQYILEYKTKSAGKWTSVIISPDDKTITVPILERTAYQFKISAVSLIGNTATSTISEASPIVNTIDSHQSPIKTAPELSGTISSDTTTLVIYRNDTEIHRISSPGTSWSYKDEPKPADNSYTYTTRATDDSGNSLLSNSMTLEIYTLKPNPPEINSPADNSVHSGDNILVTGTALAGSIVSIYYKDSTQNVKPFGWVVGNSDGDWSYTWSGYKQAGPNHISAGSGNIYATTTVKNVISDSSRLVPVSFDYGEPTIIHPTDGMRTSEVNVINGTAPPGVDEIELFGMFDSVQTSLAKRTPSETGNWEATFTENHPSRVSGPYLDYFSTKEGSHTIWIVAKTGQTKVEASRLTFVVDKTAPTISTSSLDMATGKLKVTFSEPISTVDPSKFILKPKYTSTYTVSGSNPVIDGMVVTLDVLTDKMREHFVNSGRFIVHEIELAEEAVTDLAGNPIIAAELDISAPESAPKVLKAVIDKSTKRFTITFDKQVHSDIIDPHTLKIFKSDKSNFLGMNDIVKSASSDKKSLIFTLDDDQWTELGTLGQDYYLDISLGAVLDTTYNPIAAATNIEIEDHAQLSSASLDLETGKLILRFTHPIIANTTDLEGFSISEQTRIGISSKHLELDGATTSAGKDHYELVITLTKAQRDKAGEMSRDRIEVVIAEENLRDSNSNFVYSTTMGITITLVPTPPTVVSASYNPSTGRFIVIFDEMIKKSSIDPTKFSITQDDSIVRPSAQELETSTDSTTITFLLTGSNKNTVDTFTDQQNRYLQLDANAVTDLAGNPIVQLPRKTFTLTTDNTPPTVVSASYNPSTGRFIVIFDEMIKKSSIDPTKFSITQDDSIVRPSAQELETTTDGTTVIFVFTGSKKTTVDGFSAQQNRYLQLDEDAVTDLAGNGIVQSTALTRKTFTVTDIKLPTITSVVRTDNTAQVTWSDEDTSLATYDLQYRKKYPGDEPWTSLAVTASPADVTGLTHDGPYMFKLSATRGETIVYSAEYEATIPGVAINPHQSPTSTKRPALIGTVTTSDPLTLVIYRDNQEIHTLRSTNLDWRYTESADLNDGSYTYTVRVTDSLGNNKLSTPMTVRIDTTGIGSGSSSSSQSGPPVITNLSKDQDRVTITWSAPSGSTPDSYTIEYKKTDDAEWTSISSILIEKTTHTITLERGAEYQFRMAAVKSGDTGDYSSVEKITLSAPVDSGTGTSTGSGDTSESIAASLIIHPTDNMRSKGGSFVINGTSDTNIDIIEIRDTYNGITTLLHTINVSSDYAGNWEAKFYAQAGNPVSSSYFDYFSTKEGTHTIHVTAKKNNAAVQYDRVTFEVDRTAPTISITSPANYDFNTVGSSYTVWGIVSDDTAKRVELYDKDNNILGSTSDLTDNTWSIPLTNQKVGEAKLQAKVIDDIGNHAFSNILAAEVASDGPSSTKPGQPIISLALDGNSVTASWNESSGSPTSYTLQYKKTSETTWTTVFNIPTGTPSHTIPLERGATYQFHVVAVKLTAQATGISHSSNIATISIPATPTVPVTPPTISKPVIDTPEADSVHYGGSINVNGKAPANSLVQIFYTPEEATRVLVATVGADNDGDWTYTWNNYKDTIRAGSGTLTAVAVGTSESSDPKSISFDYSPPDPPKITYPENNDRIPNNIVINGTSETSVDKIELFHEFNGVKSSLANITTTNSDYDGNWTVTLFNGGEDVNQPSHIRLNSIYGETYFHGKEGDHTIYAVAHRITKSLPTPSVTFELDTISPTTTIDSPTEGATVGGSYTVTGTVSDDTARSVSIIKRDVVRGDPLIVILGNTTIIENKKWSIPLTNQPSGPTFFDAKVIDDIDNSYTSQPISITVDASPAPVPVITFPESASFSNNVTPTISGTVDLSEESNPARVKIFNGDTLLHTTPPLNHGGVRDWTHTLPEQPDGTVLNIQVSSLDHVNNESPKSGIIIHTIDTTPPTISITADTTAEETNVISPVASATDDTSGIKSYSWINSENITMVHDVVISNPDTATPSITLPEHNQDYSVTLELTVTDNAGNSATASHTIHVTAPDDPPVLTPIDDIRLPEDASSSQPVEAYDVDHHNNTLVFSINHNNDRANFATVDSPQGTPKAIKLTPSYDDVPHDGDDDPTNDILSKKYDVTVTVTSGGSAVSDDFVITVLDVNRPPTLESATVNGKPVDMAEKPGSTFTLTEGDTVRTIRLVATDLDGDRVTFQFSIPSIAADFIQGPVMTKTENTWAYEASFKPGYNKYTGKHPGSYTVKDVHKRSTQSNIQIIADVKPAEPPEKPPNLAITPDVTATQKNLDISWDVPESDAPILSYTIQYDSSNSFANPTMINVTATGGEGSEFTTPYTFDESDYGTLYHFRVVAISVANEVDQSADRLNWSDVTSYTVPYKPAPPSNVEASINYDFGMSISWDAPEDTGRIPLTTYDIYRYTNNTGPELIQSIPGDISSYLDKSAKTPGTLYTYEMVANNNLGSSAPSERSTNTAPYNPVPSIPEVTLGYIIDGYTLTWNSTLGSEHNVEYQVHALDGDVLAEDEAILAEKMDGLYLYSYAATDLERGSKHTVYVTAVQYGINYDSKNIDITVPNVPDQINEIRVVDRKLDNENLTIALSWEKPANNNLPIKHYTVEWTITGVSLPVVKTWTVTNTSAVVWLASGEQGTAQISAVNDVGSSESKSISVDFTRDLPISPTMLSATETKDGVTLKWRHDDITNVIDYTILANNKEIGIRVSPDMAKTPQPGIFEYDIETSTLERHNLKESKDWWSLRTDYTNTGFADTSNKILERPPKSGSGSSKDYLNAPTFGLSLLDQSKIVSCGYSMDGVCRDVVDYHVDYKRAEIATNSTHDFTLKSYAPMGFRQFQIAFGLPTVGTPLSEAEATISVNLGRDYTVNSTYIVESTSYQNENNVINDNADITISAAKCIDSDTEMQCIEVAINNVLFREQMYHEPFAILATDTHGRTTMHYLNEGLLVQGESLNEAPISNGGILKKGNQHDAIPIQLVRTDKLNDLWEDQWGNVWTKNDYSTWKKLTIQEFERHDDGTWSVMTRVNSNFYKMVESEKDRATLVWDGESVQNDVGESFSFTPIDRSESRLEKLADVIGIEQDRAQKIMDTLLYKNMPIIPEYTIPKQSVKLSYHEGILYVTGTVTPIPDSDLVLTYGNSLKRQIPVNNDGTFEHSIPMGMAPTVSLHYGTSLLAWMN